jgi:hypothetical protein
MTVKQAIPLFASLVFLVGAVYPRPISFRRSGVIHPNQLIARLCLGALGALTLWGWYRLSN